jgi:hypothetical protein
MKELMQKLAMFVILGLLALLLWTQRSSLQDCGDRVKQASAESISLQDTTCSFLGRDITIKTPRRQ